MPTDKTPLYKRTERAEKSAIKWKMKSIERREEIERLNLKIKDMEVKITKSEEFVDLIKEQKKQRASLGGELEKARLMIAKQQSEIEELKKKHVLRGSKAT
jgi:predicted  nucleic acid-binding Zn-ribbon protein